jgi:hypothetical protein
LVAEIADHRTGLQRAESAGHIFRVLWPIVLSVVGLAMVIAFIAVPALRDPTLVAALGGFFTIVSGFGLARRESK